MVFLIPGYVVVSLYLHFLCSPAKCSFSRPEFGVHDRWDKQLIVSLPKYAGNVGGKQTCLSFDAP